MKNMGLAVRYFREKKYPGHGGQALAAKDAGITRATWNHYENSEKLSNATLRKISGALGVTVDDLIRMGEESVDEKKSAPVESGAIDRKLLSVIRSVSGLRRTLDDLEEHVFAGRLSADDCLKALNSLLSALEPTLSALESRREDQTDSGA